jgi:Methyl-accepting chemotaxis protein
MNWLSRLSIRAKLIASFIVVAVFAAIIGLVGLNSINRVHEMATRMHDFELTGLHYVSRADAELLAAAKELRGALLFQKGAGREERVRQLETHIRGLKSVAQEAGKYFVTPDGKALHQRLVGLVRDYETGAGKVVAQLAQDYPGVQARALEVLNASAKPPSDEALKIIGEMIQQKRTNAERFLGEIDDMRSSTAFVMLAVTLAGVILAVIFGIFLARMLSRQLGGEPQEVARIAGSIATGDLTVQVPTEGLHPNSVMAQMAAMQNSLRRLVSNVLTSSHSIANGATQIAAGNTDLSQRTEEQAANLTQTASAMEELAGTVQNNADVARQAAQRAIAASKSAEHGGEVVGSVVQTMAGITDASKRIVDIISVIDSIAFQTNILALNAAVEAARAGEQGRGFAVVASEVRSLAQKSASAAKDIKMLIDDSVQKVEDGSKLVDMAGETMEGIVAEVKQVTDLISEISAATSEQTSGIAQVNDAVLQLSDVTQQNAALVEQSAAASGSLNEQAQRLVELVRTFKIEAGADAPASAPQVISVPPATIEEGVRKPASRAASAGARTGAASSRESAESAQASSARAARPALGSVAPSLAAAGVAGAKKAPPVAAAAAPARKPAPAVAAAGKSVYGPGTSKEDDWEEF